MGKIDDASTPPDPPPEEEFICDVDLDGNGVLDHFVGSVADAQRMIVQMQGQLQLTRDLQDIETQAIADLGVAARREGLVFAAAMLDDVASLTLSVLTLGATGELRRAFKFLEKLGDIASEVRDIRNYYNDLSDNDASVVDKLRETLGFAIDHSEHVVDQLNKLTKKLLPLAGDVIGLINDVTDHIQNARSIQSDLTTHVRRLSRLEQLEDGLNAGLQNFMACLDEHSDPGPLPTVASVETFGWDTYAPDTHPHDHEAIGQTPIFPGLSDTGWLLVA